LSKNSLKVRKPQRSYLEKSDFCSANPSPDKSGNPFENKAHFSCCCRTTKGSSCNDLEKKQLLKKIETNSWKPACRQAGSS